MCRQLNAHCNTPVQYIPNIAGVIVAIYVTLIGVSSLKMAIHPIVSRYDLYGYCALITKEKQIKE